MRSRSRRSSPSSDTTTGSRSSRWRAATSPTSRGPSTSTSSTRTPRSGTRGPTRAPARARSPSAWRRSRRASVLDGWGLVYYQHYRRLLLAATRARACGSPISSPRTGGKAIDRVLGSDSLRGMAWLRRTRRPGPVRWGDRDDAARQQPRTRDRLASHHAVTCPASRRAGPGRSGRRRAARPASRAPAPPAITRWRFRSTGSTSRSAVPVRGEPDGDQPFHRTRAPITATGCCRC